jgi:hypothetical protein
MKAFILKRTVFLFVLVAWFSSCDKQYLEEAEEKVEFITESVKPVDAGDFFYYFDEKIFFQQNTERILLKSAPNIHWSQITPLLNDPAYTVSVAYWTERTPFFLLIAKDEKPIPLSILEFYMSIPEIVSVSYMYRYIFNSEFYGTYFVIEGAHTDEFSIKLKESTSFAQLQALAKQNNCTVEKDSFEENRYNLYISKTSESNAINLSKLFFESGFFEFSSPYFRVNIGGPLYPQKQTPFYYYYYDIKMYLQQVTDKILLKFSPDANREQILDIVKSNPSLQPMSGTNYEDLPENYAFHIVALETKNGKPMPSSIIESFNVRAEVVSVSYLYKSSSVQEENGLSELLGFTDEIIVKLKGTTSYEQLQELAERNNCTVGAENQFVKNQFMVYVSKTSKLNVLQTSNLFHETGIFKYSEPNFYMFGNFLHNGLKNASR